MTLTKTEVAFLVEVLKSAKVELETLENQIEWYVSKVPEELEEALEILEGIPNEE